MNITVFEGYLLARSICTLENYYIFTIENLCKLFLLQFYDLLFIFCLNISFFLVISYLCLHLMKRARLLLRKRHMVPPILEQCYCSKHCTGSVSSE